MKPLAAHCGRLPGVIAAERAGYCPACFALINVGTPVCPICGRDLRRLSVQEYREKLLTALNHPLADVRLRAIIALGWRGEGETAEALAQCSLRHPADVVEGLQVVESLHAIRDTAARERALRLLAARHPAHAVWSAASRALRSHPLS